MKILHDLVVIKPHEEEESVLVRPDSSKETPSAGVVIGVGPEVNSTLKGKDVIYRKWMGDAITINDKEYVIVKEEDILITDYKKKKNV